MPPCALDRESGCEAGDIDFALSFVEMYSSTEGIDHDSRNVKSAFFHARNYTNSST